jgi:hypothetical protein
MEVLMKTHKIIAVIATCVSLNTFSAFTGNETASVSNQAQTLTDIVKDLQQEVTACFAQIQARLLPAGKRLKGKIIELCSWKELSELNNFCNNNSILLDKFSTLLEKFTTSIEQKDHPIDPSKTQQLEALYEKVSVVKINGILLTAQAQAQEYQNTLQNVLKRFETSSSLVKNLVLHVLSETFTSSELSQLDSFISGKTWKKLEANLDEFAKAFLNTLLIN